MVQLVAPPSSKAKIYAMAEQVRGLLKLNGILRVPVISIVEERLGLYDPEFNYEYVSQYDIPGKYACYDPQKNIMTIDERVYLNAFYGSGRDRFTIAHEIGHYYLHSNEAVLARVSNKQKIPIYQSPEWQANTFASYFMMPRNLIKGMSVKEVMNACGTSYQAAEIALKD